MRNGPQIQHEDAMSRELLQRALDVLVKLSEQSDCDIDPFTFGRYGGDSAISELRAALAAPVLRCQCCGYLVTESEHKGCLRAGLATKSGPPAEPVAWRWQPSAVFLDWSWTDSGIKARELANYGVNLQPLYDHAIPSGPPAAWLMDSGDDASWVEIGPQKPAPEAGFLAVPLYKGAP
jgi:hypothetical protein